MEDKIEGFKEFFEPWEWGFIEVAYKSLQGIDDSKDEGEREFLVKSVLGIFCKEIEKFHKAYLMAELDEVIIDVQESAAGIRNIMGDIKEMIDILEPYMKEKGG